MGLPAPIRLKCECCDIDVADAEDGTVQVELFDGPDYRNTLCAFPNVAKVRRLHAWLGRWIAEQEGDSDE